MTVKLGGAVAITRELLVDAGMLPTRPAPPRPLWHFTCGDHGYAGIGKRGALSPREHPLMPNLGAVVWLTSDPRPNRDDVGLTNLITSCDRMAYRYRVVDPTDVVPWDEVRHRVSPTVRADLERYARPYTWWLASSEQSAVLA